MQKNIPSRLAIEIILFLAILVGWFAVAKFNSPESSYATENIAVSKNKTAKKSCKNHAYRGKVKIHGWLQTSSDGEQLFVVSDEDMKNLPEYEETEEYKAKNKQIKLVDMTSTIEKQLQETSKDKPQPVTITGFATRCKGTPFALASIEYKSGIFKKYLDI